jgi:hypothetical protein
MPAAGVSFTLSDGLYAGSGPHPPVPAQLRGREERTCRPPDISALESPLRGCTGLAKQLANRPASDTVRLSKAFFATLR